MLTICHVLYLNYLPIVWHSEVILWKPRPNLWSRSLIICNCPAASALRHVLLPLPNKNIHADVIKWKHFPRYWPFVRGIHRSPLNSPHKGQWRGALMFSLIYARINGWVNTGEAGDLRCHHAHFDVIVMISSSDFCLYRNSFRNWIRIPVMQFPPLLSHRKSNRLDKDSLIISEQTVVDPNETLIHHAEH